jgi:flagellar L-ring protein precursor FlgH
MVLPKAKTKEPVVRPIQERQLTAGHLEKEDPSLNSSLWRETAYRDLFKDLRAYQVGDLVTVNIVETSKASKKADTKTARQSSIKAGIINALGWEGKVGKIGVPAEFDNVAMFKASMKNDFSGSGETSRNETMTASITARVMEVTPNGNLFIKGTRHVKVNNENQIITLTGMIRPVDISPDNTVLSSYIADARIAYSGKGPVSDKQRPGWLMRIVDHVWPF